PLVPAVPLVPPVPPLVPAVPPLLVPALPPAEPLAPEPAEVPPPPAAPPPEPPDCANVAPASPKPITETPINNSFRMQYLTILQRMADQSTRALSATQRIQCLTSAWYNQPEMDGNHCANRARGTEVRRTCFAAQPNSGWHAQRRARQRYLSILH